MPKKYNCINTIKVEGNNPEEVIDSINLETWDVSDTKRVASNVFLFMSNELPPKEKVEELSQMFPNNVIFLQYDEAEKDFSGIIRFSEGEAKKVFEGTSQQPNKKEGE